MSRADHAADRRRSDHEPPHRISPHDRGPRIGLALRRGGAAAGAAGAAGGLGSRSPGAPRAPHYALAPGLELPPGKTFATLDEGRLPPALVRRLHELADGDFLDDATNVLAFGLPGVGKSHAMCAVGHALVDRGHAVLFMPTYSLVQELFAAKRNLELPRALRKLDHFAVLLLDDVGYIQQSPEEAEILFTLLAERYERRSVCITSNLIFAQWDRIFRDQMATAAAIDRLVHHSVLLEFDVPSFRTEQAKRRGKTSTSRAEAAS